MRRAETAEHASTTPRWALVAAVGSFIALEIVASAKYPGGTFRNPTLAGYSVFGNYFCDLTRDVAHDGLPNPGAPFARAAMTALSLGFVPFFVSLARFSKSLLRARLVRSLGVAAALASLMVPWLPSSRFGWVHAAITITAGVFGLAAALVGLAGAFALRARAVVLLGALSFATGLFVSVVYGVSLAFASEPTLLPIAQKVAAVFLCSWMIAVAVTFRDRTAVSTGNAPDANP